MGLSAKEAAMFTVPDQSNKLAVVTGVNSDTGKEASRRLFWHRSFEYDRTVGRFAGFAAATTGRHSRRTAHGP
jgi:hypothetical protein